MRRIQWNEIHHDEMYCFIADETVTGFEFAKRSTWDVQWYKLNPTDDLITKAKYFGNVESSPALHKYYEYHRQCVKQSVIRLAGMPGDRVEKMATVLDGNTKNNCEASASCKHPWTSGSFYLFALALMVCLGLMVEKMVHHIGILPIIMLFGLLSICFIGAFQLKQDERIADGRFLKLILESLKSLRFFKRK